MASVVIASINDNSCFVQFDLNSQGTTVVSVTAVNSGTTSKVVNVTRPSGQVVSRTLAPGDNVTLSIPKGKQFPYSDDATADWSVTLGVA